MSTQDIPTDAHFVSANDPHPIVILPPGTQDPVKIVESSNQPAMATVTPPGAGDSAVGAGASPVVGGGGKARSTEGIVPDNKAEYVKSYLRSLVYWEQPLHSAAALGSFLAINYIMGHYSPIRVLSFVIGVVTLANMVFVNAWVYSGSMFVHAQEKGVKKPPTMWFLDHANRQPIRHQLVRDWTDFGVDVVNTAFSYLASIVAVDDNVKTAKALSLIGTIYLLSGYLSSSTIFYLLTISAFAIPPAYRANKAQVDAHLNQLSETVSKHVHQVTGSASAYFNSAAAKAKAKVEEAKGKVKKHE